MTSKEKAEELRKLGNECMHGEKFAEAVLHYMHAIKLDGENHLLYSNRALAFIKLEQFYLAMEDALKAIQLQPTWAKGFYRKGQVEHAAGHYAQALVSYRHALKLDQTNATIQDAIRLSAQELHKERKVAARQPWLYIGGGLAAGTAVVLADQFLTKSPSIHSVILQLLLVAVFGAVGFGILQIYRYMARLQKKSVLEPPPDLLAEMEGRSRAQPAQAQEEGDNSAARRRRGGASTGRHKFQKGRS